MRTRHKGKRRGMQATKQFANELFDAQTAFIVPYFQRAYVWNEENWDPFLEAMEAISDGKKEHFMGFLVLKIGEDSTPPIEYSVIDGQQRLTTFFLFARALCEINEENFDKIYFYSRDNQPILFHNHNDKFVFDRILDDKAIDEKFEQAYKGSKVLECYNYFLKERRELLEKIDFDEILKNLSFVCMHLLKEDDEQKIFDTMNSLGAPLGTGDLLKNELFTRGSYIDKDAEELYEKTWKATFERENEPQVKEYWEEIITTRRLKQSNLDMLLHSYLVIMSPKKTINKGHSALFKQYKDFLNDYEGDKEAFITELMEYAKEYKEHIDIEYIKQEPDDDLLTQRLNILIFGLSITTITPYILYLLKELHDYNEKKKIFSLLESYLMRRLIVGGATRHYSDYFMSLIDNRINSYESLRDAIYKKEANEVIEMPNDDLLEHAFENRALTNSAARVVLYFLEIHAKKHLEASVNLWAYKVYSLEHIMPRDWKANWGKLKIAEEVDNRNKMVQRLGNLTILTSKLNSGLKNASWEDKKEGKKNGGLIKCCAGLQTMSEYLKEGGVWNEEIIAKRNGELLNLAKDLWKYEPPA